MKKTILSFICLLSFGFRCTLQYYALRKRNSSTSFFFKVKWMVLNFLNIGPCCWRDIIGDKSSVSGEGWVLEEWVWGYPVEPSSEHVLSAVFAPLSFFQCSQHINWNFPVALCSEAFLPPLTFTAPHPHTYTTCHSFWLPVSHFLQRVAYFCPATQDYLWPGQTSKLLSCPGGLNHTIFQWDLNLPYFVLYG